MRHACTFAHSSRHGRRRTLACGRSPSRALLALAAAARARRVNVLACEPEWASLAEGARRRQGQGLERDDCAAGPASDRGAAEPDRARAERRPAGLHGPRARDRLAAGPGAAVRQSEARAGPAGRTSRRAGSCRAREARARSIAAMAMCIPAAIRTCTSIRAISRAWRPRWRRGSAEIDPAERGVLPGAPGGVRRALERGDRALGAARPRRSRASPSSSITGT